MLDLISVDFHKLPYAIKAPRAFSIIVLIHAERFNLTICLERAVKVRIKLWENMNYGAVKVWW